MTPPLASRIKPTGKAKGRRAVAKVGRPHGREFVKILGAPPSGAVLRWRGWFDAHSLTATISVSMTSSSTAGVTVVAAGAPTGSASRRSLTIAADMSAAMKRRHGAHRRCRCPVRVVGVSCVRSERRQARSAMLQPARVAPHDRNGQTRSTQSRLIRGDHSHAGRNS